MISLAQNAPESQWGPWIEWEGGECPIPDAKAGEYEVRPSPAAPWQPGKDRCAIDWEHNWRCRGGFWPITAYRLLKSMLPQSPTKDELWYPPQQDGFGLWVEWNGDSLPANATVARLTGEEREARVYEHIPVASKWLLTSSFRHNTVAVCLKLDQPAKSEEPADLPPTFTDDFDPDPGFESRPYKSWAPNRITLPRFAHVRTMEFAFDGRSIKPIVWDPDAPMKVRDELGAMPKRTPPVRPVDRDAIAAMVAEMQREDRDEAVALATMVDPVFTHQLGRWGA